MTAVAKIKGTTNRKADRWLFRWLVIGNSGTPYTVAVDKDGNYGCSCPRWKFRREQCHHILEVMGGGGKLIEN